MGDDLDFLMDLRKSVGFDFGPSASGCLDDFESLVKPPTPIVENRVETRPIEVLAPLHFLEIKTVEQGTLALIRDLLQNGPHSFHDLWPFDGSGVYTLYYQGDLPIYEPLRSMGSTCPIYIGKAGQEASNRCLFTRLREHKDTLTQTDLGLENFTFRFSSLPVSLVEFAERLLISMFRPPWNEYLRGFGERTGDRQTSRRPEQLVSRWDAYHSGRPTNASQPRDLDVVEQELQEAVHACRAAYEKVMTLVYSTQCT